MTIIVREAVVNRASGLPRCNLNVMGIGRNVVALFSARKVPPMRKFVLTTVAVAALAGSTLAFNAFAASGDAADGPPIHGWGDHAFMLDARIAGMKAALKLTPDQEKLWGPFEAAVREGAKARVEAMRAHHDEMEKDERPSPIARLNEMSEHLAQASEELKKISEAAKPLYDSLDDTQKHHFGPLLMSLREHGGHEGMHEHGGHHEDGEPL